MQERFDRRPTRTIQVGELPIGSGHLVVVQSMITENTQNIRGATQQIKDLHLSGAKIVRVTTPTLNDAKALAEIKKELRKTYRDVPLVADVHHQGTEIAVEAAKHVEKVRINPGLLVFHKRAERKGDYTKNEVAQQIDEIDQALLPIINACKEKGVALRIGVNHGSLAERLTVMWGDTPKGMVESALEYLRICRSRGFNDVIVSLKSSRVRVMQEANRLMVNEMNREGMDYPLHLGVTEAGKDQYARVKGALGIGTLLSEGIGDTIRVSLAEDPVSELSVAYDILQGLGLEKTKAEIIACPSCGRTKFDLPKVTDLITDAVSHLRGLTIAVMGCVVNGPGEMADADYGIMGLSEGKVAIFRGREQIATVPQLEAKMALTSLIKKDGKWVDPPKHTSQ